MGKFHRFRDNNHLWLVLETLCLCLYIKSSDLCPLTPTLCALFKALLQTALHFGQHLLHQVKGQGVFSGELLQCRGNQGLPQRHFLSE